MQFLYKYIDENIFFKRIFSMRQSIAAYCFASFLDIFIILIISKIFTEITSYKFDGNIYIYILSTFILIIFRTASIFLLRKFSFSMIFKKKLSLEKIYVENFIDARIRRGNCNEEDLRVFKEKLINSSNLATVNFDIPIFSLVAELIFALGGIFILLNIFGVKLLLLNLPIFVILIIFSRFVSRKLSSLGKRILDLTDKRINTIDNLSEIAIEISALNYSKNLLDYFSKVNKPYNFILSNQVVTSNMMQIFTESGAFLIILISLVCIITNLSETSLANTATSLAVLSRMVPSFTRSISFITQLQFGVPSVKRLSQIYD